MLSQVTKGKSDSQTFFSGNRNSNWYVVAFGMVGASLSGVTFISVPGWVGSSGFTYFQVVMGYLIGYFLWFHSVSQIANGKVLTQVFLVLFEMMLYSIYDIRIMLCDEMEKLGISSINMRIDGTWINEGMFMAACRLFRVNIIIINNAGYFQQFLYANYADNDEC